jgi:hypothetical protein
VLSWHWLDARLDDQCDAWLDGRLGAQLDGQLDAMEQRLAECAARYDEEHRLRMSYDQVINRLKSEQLEWPAEVKQ